MEKKGVTIIDDKAYRDRKFPLCWEPPKLGEISMDEGARNLYLLRDVLKLISGRYYDTTPFVWFPSQEQADSFLEFVQASLKKIIRIRG